MIYKISFQLKSTIITYFQADVIFGHFCWALRYIYGNNILKEFIESYDIKPTLFSNSYPDGYLPFPILKPLLNEERKALKDIILFKYGNDFKGYDEKLIDLSINECISKIEKNELIELNILSDLKNSFSLYNYFCYIIDRACSIKKNYNDKEIAIVHNVIDRRTSTTKDVGGFFVTFERFYLSNNENLTFFFFIDTEYLSENMISNIMEYLSFSGFGAKKSSGKGALKFLSIDLCNNLLNVDNPNGFVTLSNFIPDEKTPIKCFYKLLTKFGKLGEEYAQSNNPFKKPIMMFKEGSVFFTNEKGYYGKLIRNIHSDSNIVHYAYAYPLWLNFEER